VFSDYTNRLEFCISCHEIENGPYAEYKKSIHSRNRTGVRAQMEASKSRACKGCHNFQAIDLNEQWRRAKAKHPKAIEDGKHCIQCHKGIVHELPKGFDPNG
jgi:cytochrome c-type protein NapC